MAITYEMGYTLKEFESVLTGGFSKEGSGFTSEKLSDNRWHIRIPAIDSDVTVSGSPQPPRVLGAFSLPVLQVSFQFIPDTDEIRQTFLDRFHRYFHKGGG